MKNAQVYIFDADTENLLATLSNRHDQRVNFYDSEHLEQLNGKHQFTFNMVADHPDSAHIVENNYAGFRDLDGDILLFQIYKVEQESDGGRVYKKVYCEHVFYELLDDIIESYNGNDVDALTAMTYALGPSRWLPGNIASLGTRSVDYHYDTCMAAVQQVAATYGGELFFRVTLDDTGKIQERYVDLLTRRGADTGKRMEYTRDMFSLLRRVSISGMKTALYGRGSSEETEATGGKRKIDFADVEWLVSNGDPVDKPVGQKWVGDPDARDLYGRMEGDGSRRHRFGVFEEGRSKDPATLLQNTWDKLQELNQPGVTYQCDVVDLEEITGLPFDKMRLGDTIQVIDEAFQPAIRVEARIFEIRRHLDEPERTRVTLGNFIELYVNKVEKKLRQIENELSDSRGIWDGAEDAIQGPIDDTDFPDITPPTPVVDARGAFSKIIINWDAVLDGYMKEYEIYASTVPGFTPDSTNLIFRGLTSVYTYEAEPNVQYYFQVRGINKHGTAGALSAEVSATTARIVTDDILFGAVTSDIIADLAVTAEQLAESSVTATKIANLAVGTAAINDLAVTNAKIAQLAVNTAQIVNLAVTNAKIADLAVDTAKIADLAVTNAKISELSADKITFGTMDGNLANIININASNITTGTLAAQFVSVGNQTTFENGYNPTAIIKRMMDSGFTHGKDYWVDSANGEISPSTTAGMIQSSSEAQDGPNVWSITGNELLFSKHPIPINSNRTYQVSFRVRQTIDSTDPTKASVLAGVACLDSNYQNLPRTNGTYTYVAVRNVDLTVADGWQTFTGTITGIGDSDDTFADGTKYVRPMFIVNHAGGDGTVEVDSITFEDVTEVSILEERVNEVEFKITDDSIISTVTSSLEFQDKADKSALAAYATTSNLDDAKEEMEAYTDAEISTVNTDLQTNYATKTELTQTSEALDFKFTSSGGVNLLNNSVGYSGTDFWVATVDTDGAQLPIGEIKTRQNAELQEQGSGSAFVLAGGKLEQEVSTISQYYTIATIVDKGTTGSGYIKVHYDGITETINFAEGTEYNYQQFIMTIEPVGNSITVELYGDNAGETVFTNTMVNVGNAPLQWQHNASELYNTNVLMDLQGIKVISNVYNGYTAITPQEFAGYAEVGGNMERVFTLNKDVTEVSKLYSSKEIAMGSVKIIPVVSTNYNGWSFIPNE